MYGSKGAGVAATVVSGTTAVAVLPNTGGSESIVAIAASVVAGLVAWGVTYAYVSR